MKRLFSLICVIFILSPLLIVGAIDPLESQMALFDIESLDQMLNFDGDILLEGRGAKEVMIDVLKGDIGKENLLAEVISLLKGALLKGINGSKQILFIIIISGILNVLGGENKSNIKMANTLCVMWAALVAIKVFSSFASYGIVTAQRITGLVRVMVPVLAGMLVVGGKAIAAAKIPIIIMGLCLIINEIIRNIFIPLLYLYIAVRCASSAYGEDTFEGIGDGIRSFLTYGLGVSFTIFTAVVALQGAAFKVADGALTRTIKYTLSSGIPFVGRIIADVSEIILGCGSLITSAFGIFGILAVIGIGAMPVVNCLVNGFVYNLLSGVSKTVGGASLAKMLKSFSEGFLILSAITGGVCMVFIISLAVVATKGGV